MTLGYIRDVCLLVCIEINSILLIRWTYPRSVKTNNLTYCVASLIISAYAINFCWAPYGKSFFFFFL